VRDAAADHGRFALLPIVEPTVAGALALGMAGFAGAFHDVRERAVASPYARLLVDLGVSSGPAAPSQPAR
jgi:hypothetical protein